MSHVTNVLLSTVYGDDADVMNAVNASNAEWDPYRKQQFVAIAADAVGGSRCLEVHLSVAALNHVDIEALMRCINGLPIEEATMVQLLICGQDDDGFWVWNRGEAPEVRAFREGVLDGSR